MHAITSAWLRLARGLLPCCSSMSDPIMPRTRLIPRTKRVERQHAEEAIAHLKRAGFAKFQLLAARDGWDCPECAALDGKVYGVDAPPRLPPLRCRCKPFGCRLVVVACHEDGEAARR